MRKRLLLFALLSAGRVLAGEPIAVIAYPGIPKTDAVSLQRLYTGRSVSIAQLSAVPLNLPAGHPARQQFLETLLGQDEEQYTAYWLVRRYVGKGAPPKEVAEIDEVIGYVRNTPGAVGYLPLSAVPAGANVIFRR
jgi:hypothetical protein